MAWRTFSVYSNWTLIAVLVLCFMAWTCSSRTVRRIRNNRPHTKIACEGETLNITCPQGHAINIILANYGRFSVNECNERSEMWAGVQCMYPNSKRVMQERCDNRTACTVEATNSVFEDSCPNIGKYLETQYDCVPYTTLGAATLVSVSSTESPGSTPAPSSSVPDFQSTESTVVTSTIRGFTVQHVSQKPSFCPEIERRGLKWPATRVNNPAKLPCPNNADAYAEWWCSAEGEWILENPDLSRCISSWARQLESQSKSIDNEEAAKTLARNLQADTRTNKLYGGDASASVDVVYHLSSTANSLAKIGEPSPQKIEFLSELNKYLTETGSNLLQEERRSAWLDLPPSNRSATADRLVTAIENMAVTIAKRLDGSTSSVPFVSPKISVEVSNVQIQDYVQFPARSLYNAHLDTIQLPRDALEKSGHESREWAKVTFVSYDSLLGDYMRPEAAIVVDENGAEAIVERRVVSKLISASIVNWDSDVGGSSLAGRQRDMAIVERLSKPVFLTFALKRVEENMSNAACVHWRTSDRKWSTEGCSVQRQNGTHVSCSCDHLTTFAVLMDIRGLRMEPVHQLALSFITCVGCIISICCCAIAIVAFCCFSGNHYTDRTTIHKNLCFCLMVAELIFLFGIAQTQSRLACSVVAGLLHYFFLAAFAWMLLEGFQLYSLLIEVFESERSRKPYFYMFGYGMPAVIVGISLLIDRNSYGTRRHCWLNTENYFVLSFVVPVVVVLAANLIFLVMAFVVMCRHATFVASHRHDANRSTIENVAGWLKGAAILVVLLGLTWAFGLLHINDATLAMAYAFTALNSFQGCFIFVFHVLLNEKMRKEWNKWLMRRRGRRTPPSWIRSPAASADYKPAKAHMDEPMPMLIGVKATESETLQTPLALSSASEEPSLLSKIFGGQKQRTVARGSVGQLLIRSGSVSSGQNYKYEYPYGNHSNSSEAATNSDLAVESPCARYSVSPRPPPNFPPPSPPRQSSGYYCRQQVLTGTMPMVRAPTAYGVHADLAAFDRAFVDESRDDGDQGNPYATTDAYIPADSERPDSGYSGSAHRPTPPPAPCCLETDVAGGWPSYVRRVSPGTNYYRHQQRQKQSADLNYEVPVHAATNSTASVSPAHGVQQCMYIDD